MNGKWIALPLLAWVAGAAVAANGIRVISANDTNGAWIGYSDGSVRFCNGGGGTAVPFWTHCTTAVEAGRSPVTDISNHDDRAWIGYADGQLRYCKDGGSDQHPTAECVAAKP